MYPILHGVSAKERVRMLVELHVTYKITATTKPVKNDVMGEIGMKPNAWNRMGAFR